nr:immunoglobulin light chain junction region [Macaca mulatta]MOX48316.1 immunoglobulin light chain junction region [Macaca mulatta]MOX49806.1 immunoglobulin light chain junction region [Macaca mulatta]
CQHYNNLVLTF